MIDVHAVRCLRDYAGVLYELERWVDAESALLQVIERSPGGAAASALRLIRADGQDVHPPLSAYRPGPGA